MIFALARHLLESTCFTLIALTVLACLRNRSAATRHTILLAAVAKFVLPLQWLFALGEKLRTLWPSPKIALPSALIIPVALSPSVPTAFGTSDLIINIAITLWIGSASLFLLLWLCKLCAPMETWRNVSVDARAQLENAKMRMQLNQKVRLLTVSRNIEPHLRGIFHMTIILPQDLELQLTTEQFQTILLHELAHVKRRDNLTRALVHILACIFWFYPLLWWLERRINAEGELACDELVLMAGARPQEYLDGILHVCSLFLLQPVAGHSKVSGSNLKQRLEFIMSNRIRRAGFLSAAPIGALLLTGLGIATVATGFLTGGPLQAQASKENRKAQASACVIASHSFPQGTVVRQGGRALQTCTEIDGQFKWVAVTNAARDQNKPIIEIPDPAPPAPISCKPTAPDGKFCTCENKRFSPGAAVGSATGVLVCPASGGQWQPADGKQVPWPPPPIASR